MLAGLSGWVDAAGVTGSSRVFLSFMSGNNTDLAASLIHQNWPEAGFIGAVLGMCVTGVIVGELLEPIGGWFGSSLVLGIEGVTLAIGRGNRLARSCTAALGNAVHPLPDGFRYGPAERDNAPGRRHRRIAEYAALWLCLTFGAGFGAAALSISRLAALSAAAELTSCLAGATAVVAQPIRR